MKYEYQTIKGYLNDSGFLASIVTQLNELGQEGWKVVAVLYHNREDFGKHYQILLLMREVA